MGALALMTLGAATVRVYPPPAAGDVAVALGGASADPASAESLLHQVGGLRVGEWVGVRVGG